MNRVRFYETLCPLTLYNRIPLMATENLFIMAFESKRFLNNCVYNFSMTIIKHVNYYLCFVIYRVAQKVKLFIDILVISA